jgi:glycosyltransferase involved in cell wall biosynthesis
VPVVTGSDHRIAVCLLADELPLGGAESLQLTVLSGLDRSRFRAQAICLREPGLMASRFEAAGVPVTVLGRRGRRHLTTVPVLARELRRRGTDVLLMTPHDATMALGPFAGRLGACANVLGLHQIGGKQIGIPSFPHRSVELMRLIDVLVLLTDAQHDYLVAEEGFGRRWWRRTRVAVIPNGIEIPEPPGPDDARDARRDLGVAPNAPTVGIVAALRAEKDHETLLRAIAHLAPARPDLRLVMIGSGDREDALRAETARLGLDEQVVFAGFRPDATRLLAGLDVVALVSVQETFPVSVLEAMAACRPVVMTRCEGVPEVVVDGVTGYMVDSGDDSALAERLGRLLDDPALSAQMGAAGRARAAKQFPIGHTIARYEELFTRLAQPQKGAV